jgi:hypothetical protein
MLGVNPKLLPRQRRGRSAPRPWPRARHHDIASNWPETEVLHAG